MSRNLRLHSVRVGDKVRLLPDSEAPTDRFELRVHPNSELGLGSGALEVVEVMVRDDIVMLRVEGSFKILDLRRFCSV